MHNFKKLEVWIKAMEIAKCAYELTSDFPSEEKYGLTSQLRRSAVSIPSNIAEGAGRNSKKEFNQFLAIARGSAAELNTQLILAESFNYISNESLGKIEAEITHCINMINKLQEKLKSQLQ